MPKTKKSVPAKKQKLTKEERSAVAKARWAKRKANDAMEDVVVTINTMLEKDAAKDTPAAPQPPPEQPPAVPESVAPMMSGEPLNVEPFRPAASAAPQLVPVAPKKQKRYQGPKEFSVALKAAENRLAKAITERAEALGKLAGLNAEIPSLIGIINALKGSQSAVTTLSNMQMPLDTYPPVQYPAPQPYVDPMAAVQAAQVAPPMSRAQGGAIQFSPEVLGSLEGPDDDDDPDRYLTGPLAGGGWK